MYYKFGAHVSIIGGMINITYISKYIIITVFALVFLTVVVTQCANLSQKYKPQESVQIIDGCRFGNLPSNYDVHAVSSYEGRIQISDIIDKYGNRNGLNDVIVNVENKPIILVLTAYEPVLWRIQSTTATKIIGVVLGGYYNQALLGISKDIPVLNYTHTQNNCGYFYLSNTLDNAAVQNLEKIQQITGKKPDNIQYKYNGDTFYVGNFNNNYTLANPQNEYKMPQENVSRTPQELREISIREEKRILAEALQKQHNSNQWQGNTSSETIPQRILEANNWKENATVYLVNNNYIRKSSILDIERWIDKAKEPYRQAMDGNTNNMNIVHDMSTDHTYVVQRSFKIPDDFCYGHFINFIIPSGVSAPENKQNCGYYFLKDGSKM